MRPILFLLLLCSLSTQAQTIISHAYGQPTHPAIIFLHGGPGSNATNFECATAQKLADQGFYVITYDRRGEGRSVDSNARYTFRQSYDDLHNLYTQYHLQKAALIGFSFGGIIATGYTTEHADQVSALVLVSALVNLQETYHTIIRSCTTIYKEKKDTTGLKDLAALSTLDRGSIEFRRGCFRHASKNGFFATPHRTAAAKEIYKKLDADTLYQHYAAHNNDTPSYEFWKHEHYSLINNTPVLKQLQQKGVKIYAIYGKDDGLYSPAQVTELQQIIRKDHLLYLPDAAHYLYNDQQVLFLQAFKKWKGTL
jgi:proline iminopeptidase